jgi:Fur family transcriptional regulator, ferric uptake regulator
MAPKTKKIDDTRQMLRDSGLRATPARIAVFELLAAAEQPSTHQEISERLENRGIDKSTVFRALNDLTEAGLARRMELGDHVWRYEPTRASGSEDGPEPVHPHLLCVDCGAITCLDEGDVTLKIAKSVGVIEDILLKGHCANCAADRKLRS